MASKDEETLTLVITSETTIEEITDREKLKAFEESIERRRK
jgi:hypothetical protein